VAANRRAQYQMNVDAPETKEAFTDIAKFFDRYPKQ
jgi:monoterpene epsilon-lactone hydrolase